MRFAIFSWLDVQLAYNILVISSLIYLIRWSYHWQEGGWKECKTSRTGNETSNKNWTGPRWVNENYHHHCDNTQDPRYDQIKHYFGCDSLVTMHVHTSLIFLGLFCLVLFIHWLILDCEMIGHFFQIISDSINEINNWIWFSFEFTLHFYGYNYSFPHKKPCYSEC